MELDTGLSGALAHMETAELAVVRHQFQNRIQTMTSLVGLFGRRLAPGPCRCSFEDLRARFEAVTFGHDDDAGSDPIHDLDLAELAKRVVAFLDPDHGHRLSISGGAVRVSQRRGAVVAQILAELLIDLVRNGFGDAASGAAELTVEALADGGLKLCVAQSEPATDPAGGGPDDLGLALARSMAASLGGALSRSPIGPLVIEVSIPPETPQG